MPPQKNLRAPSPPAPVKSARRRRPVDVRDNFTLAVVRKSRGGEFVSTYAEHQQSGHTEEWAGWQPPKLVSFFEQQTGGPWDPPDTVGFPYPQAPTVTYGPVTLVSSVLNGRSVTTHYQVEMIVTTPLDLGRAAGLDVPAQIVEQAVVEEAVPADGVNSIGRSVIAFEQIIAAEGPAEGAGELIARLTLDADDFASNADEVVMLVDVFARCGPDPIGSLIGSLETGLWEGRPPIEVPCSAVPAEASVYALVRVESTRPRGSAVASIPGGTLEVVSSSP
jgi:hypothetical protein